MWKNFIERHKGKVKSDFPISTLAHISAGYSAGSILKTCEKVLSVHRVRTIESRPLQLAEFIGPLSSCDNTMGDVYEEHVTLTDFMTGQDKIRKKLLSDADGGDDPHPGPGRHR